MNEFVFIIVIGMVLLALCIVILNQMLMTNAINKRLMLLNESLINEIKAGSIQFNDIEPEIEEELEDEPFDPHKHEV